MVFVTQPSAICSVSTGLIPHSSQPKLPFHSLKCNRNPSHFNGVKIVEQSTRQILRGGIRKSTYRFGATYGVGSESNYNQSSFDGDLPQEPFPLALIKEAIWSIRSLCAFLVEQPSQLKYIEWPDFLSTLKTAVLTLVLVALLIVALSSVDSLLSFLLALILRRTV